MSEQDYASKDLKRRPFRSAVVLLSMTSVVATTMFLFLFGNVLLDVTSFVTSTGLNAAFGVFFQTFIWATLLLVIVLGVVVISAVISLEMVSRRRDIALMKSIGTMMDTIFDHFMAQAVVLLLSSIVLGVAIGLGLFLAGLTWLSFTVTGISFTFTFPWLQILFLVGLYILVGYYSAQRPIYTAVHEAPMEALNPDVGLRVRRVGYLDSFGMPFRLASKATGRRIKGTRRTILSLMLSVGLASLLWIGGGVVQTTTDAYVERAMGTNIVAVGSPDLLEQYYSAYSLSGTRLNETFDYLQSENMIPDNLVTSIDAIQNVLQVEQRLLAYTTVAEGPGIIWNPTTEQYERIGEDRVSSSLIVGLDWESTVSDWYYEGLMPSAPNEVWIGGEMANDLYVDPLIQSLGVRGESLDVSAIAFDVLNGGNVAFMDLERMKDIWALEGNNILLVQLRDYTSATIDRIQTLAQGSGFDIFLQQGLLEENIGLVDSFWNLLVPLPVMALISAFLSLLYYLMVSVFGRFRDYVIMRSVGATPRFIAKTMVAEGIDLGLKSGVPAIILGVLSSIYVLVPEAAIPSLVYLPLTISAMIFSLLLVVVFSAVPVYLIFNSRSDLRVSEFAY